MNNAMTTTTTMVTLSRLVLGVAVALLLGSMLAQGVDATKKQGAQVQHRPAGPEPGRYVRRHGRHILVQEDSVREHNRDVQRQSQRQDLC